jgi:hypothetical protein
MTMKTAATFCLAACLALLLPPTAAPSSATPQSQGALPAATPVPVPVEDTGTLITLKSLARSMESLRQQIRGLEAELRAADTEDQKIRLLQGIRKQRDRLEGLERDFEGIATGVALEDFTTGPPARFDWKKEIEELLGPVLQELKDMTARPREVERLRSDVTLFERRRALSRTALFHLDQLIASTRDPEVGENLQRLRHAWQEKEQQAGNQLAVAQYQLTEKRREEKSFFESMQSILQMFFKSRGRNFLLACLAFMSVFLLLRFCHRYFSRFLEHLQTTGLSFYGRVANLSYYVFSFLGATAAALFVLYASGDWALLGLALLFLVGLAWTGKQSIPKFWQEYKLLLNLGTVKENERLIYNGIPWKVRSLNFYAQLVNPDLKGGVVNLPLSRLVGMHSRPYHPDEPWFPCREGDWVILADGTYGKVVLQCPETVQLILLGGSRKTYGAATFLQLNPLNLSTNFRLNARVRLDYRHQAESTGSIPARLASLVTEALHQTGHGQELIQLGVEFKEAGASSIDLEIIADFRGAAAKDYDALSRTLPRLAVEACNAQGWVIPTAQITVHSAART